MECPTLNIAHFMGKKWTVALLQEIALGKFDGFNKVLKKSGLTPKILSSQLKEMEVLGLIEKTENKKSIYGLTDKGYELKAIVDKLKLFSEKWENIQEVCMNKSCLECSNFNASKQ